MRQQRVCYLGFRRWRSRHIACCFLLLMKRHSRLRCGSGDAMPFKQLGRTLRSLPISLFSALKCMRAVPATESAARHACMRPLDACPQRAIDIQKFVEHHRMHASIHQATVSAPSRHSLSRAMILSTALGSAYRRRWDSLTRSGLPPLSAANAARHHQLARRQTSARLPVISHS